MNPGQMKKLMQQMGIKNTEVPATRVVIESSEGNLVVENPSVTMIEMGGQKTLQIMGDIHEEKASEKNGKTSKQESEQSDVELVMARAKCSKEEAEKALEQSNGDIVEAIMLIEKE